MPLDNIDELVSITLELGKVVEEVGIQVNSLSDEREETTGEVRNAYDLVIANKIWIIQALINAYWLKTNNLSIDKKKGSNAAASVTMEKSETEIY